MKHFRTWETAALLALSFTLLAATWAQGQQSRLSGKLIRLHVLAASDSEGDQAAKLRARDAVLELVTPALQAAADETQAAETVLALRPALARAAAEAAGTTAQVTLSRESYPTRRYESFALPAGEYNSLRVTLGEGAGRNWWCVVYPPLCLQSASAARETGVFGEEELRLITEDGEEYEFRFRLLELWGELTGRTPEPSARAAPGEAEA